MSTYVVHVVGARKPVAVEADFSFNNDGTLVFRAGERGATVVVAEFMPGAWASYQRVPQEEPAPRPRKARRA